MQPKLNQEHGKVKMKDQFFFPNAMKLYVSVKYMLRCLLFMCSEAFFWHKTVLYMLHF